MFFRRNTPGGGAASADPGPIPPLAELLDALGSTCPDCRRGAVVPNVMLPERWRCPACKARGDGRDLIAGCVVGAPFDPADPHTVEAVDRWLQGRRGVSP